MIYQIKLFWTFSRYKKYQNIIQKNRKQEFAYRNCYVGVEKKNECTVNISMLSCQQMDLIFVDSLYHEQIILDEQIHIRWQLCF